MPRYVPIIRFGDVMKTRHSIRSLVAQLARSLLPVAAAVSVLCAPPALAAGPDGQLWYTAQRFLTTNSTNDNQVGRINADKSSQTAVLISPDTSKYYLSVGVDTAAGFYFALHNDFNTT